MTSVIVESVIISLSVLSGFLLSFVAEDADEVFIVALLFVIYFLGKKLVLKNKQRSDYIFDSAVFTVVVVLTVVTSGGLASPLYFLLYFLLFGVGLLVQPLVSLTTSITIAILLVYSGQTHPSSSLPALISLPFITPFAVLLGKEFRKAKKLEDAHTTMKETSLIFLSTVLKEHIQHIGDLAENFKGDHELDAIKRSVRRTKKLVDKFEHDIEHT